MPENLKYNDIVYVPTEDFSFFKIMLFRPDRNGYLLECCDSRLIWGSHYKMIYLDQLEKAMFSLDQMEIFWEKEIQKLNDEISILKENQKSNIKNIEAKIQDMKKEILVISKKLETITSPEEKLKKEKAIKQIQKGIKRTKKKTNLNYNNYISELELEINKKERKIQKYKEDKEIFFKIVNKEENTNIYKTDNLSRKIVGNSIR